MNFNAAHKFSSPVSSSPLDVVDECLKQRYSTTVPFDKALAIANDLVFAKRGRYLTEPEITVMKGAWNNRDYEEIAEKSRFSVNYLQRGVATRLFDILTKTIGNGEKVSKKNLRNFLEQLTEEYDAQFTSQTGQSLFSHNLGQVIGGQPPDISNFLGRTNELELLKELITKQRCIALVGVAGIGKTTLAAKLIAELSVEAQPTFDCLVWKSVAHAPSVHDLVTDLLELFNPSEPKSNWPEYTQAMITVLLKQLQSRRYLIVLDEFEALFQTNNLAQRLDYRLFIRRLVEEQHQSCLLLTSRVLLNDLHDLIAAKRPLQFFKIQGLDPDAAMQFLSSKGLTDKENCHSLIETYRGNPSELEALVERINHFFAGSTEKFLENETTLVSSKIETMLTHVFSQILTEIERTILIHIAEEIVSKSQTLNFTTLLNNLKERKKILVSTFDLIKALEKLERQSLIESTKDPVTKEISFTIQPVIKKYILTDPQGLVHVSDTLPTLANAS
ncbi:MULTISPECIES: NB-ARC domain-containing protein [Nostoc]|uniref:NACHT domain-containing protein n=1 Tax=Nostoc paludosum FACHB-159 TaxID=2692908 RepID=A0ABR8KIZ6_9NOSO|nr:MULTISPECIES: NB-ARC domain-containing protein [Nostoc]MBD2683216.1 NACHT domain-containing protein [Nostoc sp. FACHB-857]MBD2739543.1 NACHT domain-containing protein [Nostoc paludosum FACHB-159]